MIASYEAANNIIIFSHNYVIGNKQGWPYEAGLNMEAEKNLFFTGGRNTDTVKSYLKNHQIRYIYKGYQEDDGFLKDPYYREVYRNPEVTIYKVNF